MPLGEGAALINDAVRWRSFDRAVQAVKAEKARHAGVPAEALQAAIDAVCSAVRQEM